MLFLYVCWGGRGVGPVWMEARAWLFLLLILLVVRFVSLFLLGVKRQVTYFVVSLGFWGVEGGSVGGADRFVG